MKIRLTTKQAEFIDHRLTLAEDCIWQCFTDGPEGETYADREGITEESFFSALSILEAQIKAGILDTSIWNDSCLHILCDCVDGSTYVNLAEAESPQLYHGALRTEASLYRIIEMIMDERQPLSEEVTT